MEIPFAQLNQGPLEGIFLWSTITQRPWCHWLAIFVKKNPPENTLSIPTFANFLEGKEGKEPNTKKTYFQPKTQKQHPKTIQNPSMPMLQIYIYIYIDFCLFLLFFLQIFEFKIKKTHKRQKMQVLFPCSIPPKTQETLGRWCTAQVSKDLEASDSVSEPEALAESREPRLGRHILKGCPFICHWRSWGFLFPGNKPVPAKNKIGPVAPKMKVFLLRFPELEMLTYPGGDWNPGWWLESWGESYMNRSTCRSTIIFRGSTNKVQVLWWDELDHGRNWGPNGDPGHRTPKKGPGKQLFLSRFRSRYFANKGNFFSQALLKS